MSNVNNQFKFSKGWSSELSGFYRTSGIDGQILIKPMGQLNAGVQKQVLKNKGTLKLNVRDILYTMTAKGDINFQRTEASFRQQKDSRVVTLRISFWQTHKRITKEKNRRSGNRGKQGEGRELRNGVRLKAEG